MKKIILGGLLLLFSFVVLAQNYSYMDYVLKNEQHPSRLIEIRNHCLLYNLPVSVVIENNGIIEVVALENNTPVYAHVRNIL